MIKVRNKGIDSDYVYTKNEIDKKVQEQTSQIDEKADNSDVVQLKDEVEQLDSQLSSQIVDLNNKVTNVPTKTELGEIREELYRQIGDDMPIVYDDFKYGNTKNHMNPPDLTTSKQFKYVVIDVENLEKAIGVHSSVENYIPLGFVTFYSNTYTRLVQSADWISDLSTITIKPKSGYPTLPTIKYACVTFAYSTDGTIGTSLSEIPLDGIYIGENITVNKTLNEKIKSLQGIVTIVDKNGNGKYTTIAEAVANAQDGENILINSGVYDEHVVMNNKNIHLMGINKETTFLVHSSKEYGNEPLQANIGSVSDLTIIAGYGMTIDDNDQEARAYAVHVESAYSTPYTLDIENCNVISYTAPAIGIGCRYNQRINIKDCYLETTRSHVYSSYTSQWAEFGAIFCHNDNSGANKGNDGYLNVENCELKGNTTALTLQSQDNGNKLTTRFINNVLWSTTNGTNNALTVRNTSTSSGHIAGNDVVLDTNSFGNNINELNVTKLATKEEVDAVDSRLSESINNITRENFAPSELFRSGSNLINRRTITEYKFLGKADGQPINSSNQKITDYVTVDSNVKYVYSGTDPDNKAIRFCQYDSDYNWLKTSDAVTSITTLVNAKYVRVGMGINSTDMRLSKDGNQMDVPDNLLILYKEEISHIPNNGFYKEEYHVGTGYQFTRFTDCINFLAGNSNHKTIYVHNGVYDIFEEIGGESFLSNVSSSANWWDVNPIVPPNTDIIGVGRVVFEYNLPDNVDATKAVLLSCINMRGSASIENIMIRCNNLRYAIHAEGSTFDDYNEAVYKIKDCNIIREDGTYANAVVGAGNNYGGRLEVSHCYIETKLARGSAILYHGNTTELDGSPSVKIDHCILKTPFVSLQLLTRANSNANIIVDLYSCYLGNQIYKSTNASVNVDDEYDVTMTNCNHVNVSVASKVVNTKEVKEFNAQ